MSDLGNVYGSNERVVPIKDFFIVYLNKDYVEELNIPLNELSEGNCDIHRLFLKKSILKEILTQQTGIEHDISVFKQYCSRQ